MPVKRGLRLLRRLKPVNGHLGPGEKSGAALFGRLNAEGVLPPDLWSGEELQVARGESGLHNPGSATGCWPGGLS